MKTLMSYLRRQYKRILMLALFIGIFATVFSLYNLPIEAVVYATVLCLVAGLIFFAEGYWNYAVRRRHLQRLFQNVEEVSFNLPSPASALEADYQALLKAVAADRARLAAKGENSRRDIMDYFTLWAHQIKTPLAAMHLLTQEKQVNRNALNAELLKTGEYVEMVLSYLRLESDTTDYVLHQYELDKIVKECIRKYAQIFILKKIHLEFDATGRTVLTDEKWLAFVIGQILSNALKYTPKGGSIRIYGDGETLVISDNGIGIRDEDLPRVFEKGFTGYNGREDKKASGIGLYLCHRILTKLGHGITITSQVGHGTLVRLLLANGRQVVE